MQARRHKGCLYSFSVQVCKHCGTRCNVHVSKLVQKMSTDTPCAYQTGKTILLSPTYQHILSLSTSLHIYKQVYT